MLPPLYNMKKIFLLSVVILVSGDRIVTTNSGPVKGSSVPGKKVEAFLGVPYAEPPVGELRFAKPITKSPWTDTYDANKLPAACVQYRSLDEHYDSDPDYKMDEDCLYLNLWVPEGGSDLKPVMVFIHSGGYMLGSSNMKIYDGAKLSDRGDVIVATFNYRLGTLGFFSGFIVEAEGSMGMYDQVMAIQWIKDNVKHFGGEPDNIVLFGESAGAFSLSFHMVSPLSKHLFKRGILQSGSAFHPMYSDNNELLFIRCQEVAALLGCADDIDSLKKNPEEVVDCMKRLPAEKFSEADAIVMATSGWLMPRVGNSFLPKNPIDLYQKSDFEDKDVLIGMNRNEGSVFVSSAKPQIFGVYGEKAENIVFNHTSVEEILGFITTLGGEDRKVFESYLNRVKDEMGYTYLDALSDITGDYIITCSVVFQADCQSKTGTPVYFYMFDYRPPSTILAKWMGVAHFEEVQYVFGNPMYSRFSEFEEELSKSMMDMWVAFAKTGNPNIPGRTKWPRYTLEDPKYFVISKTDSVGVRPDNNRCDAWKKLFRYDNGMCHPH